ncbi:MAG TPA: DUF4388 domain-containing protein [Polyangiaceae bacterium]|nr:DUF4388 domain-containing protein [Polyangiaceae bacterium]
MATQTQTAAINDRTPDRSAEPASGSTTLRGRIEAIGIHDLLRVSVSKGSSGRLLVFNEQSDSELYYEHGRLMAVTSGSEHGPECLEKVLGMTEGEFEFAWGLVAEPERRTADLHERMLAAVKEFYERQVRERAKSRPEGRLNSGVHKVAAPAESSPSDAARNEATAEPAAAAAAGEEVPVGELGRATLDAAGRVIAREGTFTQYDAGLAALTLKVAAAIGSALAVKDLQGFEVHAAGGQGLVCLVNSTGMRAVKTSVDMDIDVLRKRLEK